jgi:two-component system response regulator DevR
MEKIKVFLSNPQVLFREGIHFILSGEDDVEVTGETKSNEEAYPLIEGNPPNVAILSMVDAKVDGVEITRHIRRNLTSVYVILIMDKTEPEKVFLAVKSGASACVTKDIEPESLLDIIRVVAQGSLPVMDEMLSPALASMIITEFEDLAALNEQFDNLLANITPREKQILTLLASNIKLEAIAAKLELSEDTIRHSIRLILNKLVSNDQARAVIEAAQRSLPSIMATGKRGVKAGDYITRTEFNEFKENLMERLKSFIGELA